jgi:hypothetical protein
MSRFMRLVKLKLGSKREAPIEPVRLCTEQSLIESRDIPNFIEYEVKVEWRQFGHCRTEDAIHIQKNCIDSLRRLVYDEFEDTLLDLERGIYENDRSSMIRAVHKLRQLIYD